MYFRRFYDEGLAQASYLIGCDQSGEAVVVDAGRDIAPILAVAAAERFRIVRVTETHIHADFVSGSRELAAHTGATLALSAEGGSDWQYVFARDDGAELLRDGDSFSIGRVRFEVLHTPGHTPEHLAFLVTDLAASPHPVGLLSGDCLFVGDVGRPDLLERAAKVANTMETSARALFASLQRLRALPDFVQVWPGHGAGSACGKALGALPQSTIGYERIANWSFAATDEAAFVRDVLAGVLEGRDWVVDTRPTDAFAGGHVPRSLNIPIGKSFPGWAGTLLPYDRDIYLIAATQVDATRATREMAKIGLDRVGGWFAAQALAEWSQSQGVLERVAQTTPAVVAERVERGEVTVVDVRNAGEWEHGHLPGALHIPLGALASRAAEIPAGRPVVVHCQGGTRSAIAASILLGKGARDVINLRGGYDDWRRAGLPSVTD
jgi:hydroxyacylglutathione hydrolase